MRPTVLLFDVDGTLITTGGVGRRAVARALETRAPRARVDFSFAGMTDRLIVRQALESGGEVASEAAIDAIIDHYLEVLVDEVARADESSYRIHPGMREAIAAAERTEGVAVGLGTGNVERGARIKLERVGISDRFGFGGFGCDAEDRAKLIRVGAERGAARLGVLRERCRVVVIGDTPRDVAAAKAIGAESLAVATGTVAHEELAACSPSHLFASLAAPGALASLLG
jgi:phosphoglycolate phosphatase-like HAD superfamily hydrolase